MGGSDDSGLDTVEVPRRLNRWVDKFSELRLQKIVAQLRDGKWLSDSGEICESRSQAYYRAEALIERLVQRGDYAAFEFKRRTWPESGGHRWAIKLRED